ncbi:hypothetical protein V6N13_039765 [Hibiscus sabdariffa]|uniref:RING-type domain-containing protein n=1 Tax=Hibiscus sabdariffa TaxID=183260 RepID=A0ABR2SUH3_9ROSI
MAVQAHSYLENLGLPLPMPGLQDWMPIPAPAPALLSFDADICFNLQDPPPRTLPFHLDQNASSSTCGNFLSTALSQSLDAQLEIERLKSVVREQGKRQLAVLIKGMETKALYLMRRKEEELARATKKTMELEASLKKAEMERESWERLAKANEATVLDLSKALGQVKKGLIRVANAAAEDAESLCCGSCDKNGDVKEEESSEKIACKHCNSRSSCVLFLPCRHLCSCMSCEAFLDSCPVCKSVKEASMKIFWV